MKGKAGLSLLEEIKKQNEKEGMLKRIEVCLGNHTLYHPTAKDYKKLGVKTDFLKTNLYIDHVRLREGNITQHPYSIDMERLKEFIKECEENGITFWISGHSCYFPGETFCITMEKKEGKRD